MPEPNDIFMAETNYEKAAEGVLRVIKIHYEFEEHLSGEALQIQDRLSRVSNELAQEQTRAQRELDEVNAKQDVLK